MEGMYELGSKGKVGAGAPVDYGERSDAGLPGSTNPQMTDHGKILHRSAPQTPHQ